ELELSDSLDKLEIAAKATFEEIPTVTPASLPPVAPALPGSDQTVNRVLEIAATSPKAALLFLASELERALTRLLASVGKLEGRGFVPFREGMAILRSHAG